MRRFSVLLSSAAVVLILLVAYTYVRRSSQQAQHAPRPIARVEPGVQATAKEWHENKDDPQTNCPVIRAVASSFRSIHEPSTFELTNMRLKLFNKGCTFYTYIETPRAVLDEYSGVMTSKDPVLILMKVPKDTDPANQKATANLLHVRTSGVRYETKTGKVDTNQPASFTFADGNGQGVGADYDPNTHQLHIKSQVSLDWTGKGPAENALHVEAGELRYEEDRGKVYLSPWSRLTRQSTVINAADSEITLDDGVLQQIVSMHATGLDNEDNRHVTYGADKVISQFNDQGDMTGIIAEPNAHLTSESGSSKTSVTAQKAVLHFDIQTEMVNGEPRNNSILHDAIASGNAVVESSPVPQPNKAPADTRILRSEQILIAMKPGGREIDSLTTNTPGEFEIKPNQPNRAHRWLDGETIRVVYGDANSVDSFHATKASTRTQKPLTAREHAGKDGKALAPRPPALTWSDELDAKFAPKSSDLASLVQNGNFRYQEGERHATADSAHLDQLANRITLVDHARVWDENGTTSAEKIVLNQQSGDMDAAGHVASTREPDQEKKGDANGSLLDQHKPLQARADKMTTQDHNLKVTYDGHAILWQGANRLQADLVDIDRSAQTIHATGHVVSQLVDHQQADQSDSTAGNGQVRLEKVAAITKDSAQSKPKPIVYTLVRAPEMVYRDDTRIAHYTGGVTLIHDKTTVESKELRAFLKMDDVGNNKTSGSDSGGTSLDHAFADGDVKVTQAGSGRSRTGMAQHCEYYPKESKVVLNGGSAKMLDSRKGTTIGRQLTYWSNSDHVLVEGAAKDPVVSDMNRRK